MRRPLFAAALCFAAMLAVWLQAAGPPAFQALSDGKGREIADGETVTVTGRVIEKEVRSDFGQQKLSFILDSDFSYHLKCVPEDITDIPLGSRVTVRGTVAYFSQAGNPGQFDMAQYYRTLGIGGVLEEARVLGREPECWRVREGLYRLRCSLKERLYRLFPEKEASLLTTILLGDKTSLDSGVKELYKRNGIVHILSISGLHITILGMGLYRLLRRCGLRIAPAAVCGGTILLLYGVMTGMGVSACRAVGMYLIRMLAECMGRTYDMLTALGVMAVLMLCGRPEYLRHSGFLLSFASIMAVGLFLPAVSGRKGEGNGIVQSFLAGISITLFTLPIHFWFYYEIPVYSIFLNLCVLPLMSVVMAVGLIVLFVPGAGVLGAVDCGIFYLYEKLCLLSELLPGHAYVAGRPQPWQILAFYGIAAVFMVVRKKKRKALWLAAMALVLSVRFRSGTSIAFLDVGQGDCIVLETEGEVYVFDGGSSSESGVGRYILIPYLKYRGIDRIDAILVSHPDRDHISGVEELLELGPESGITVDRLVLPAIAEELRQEAFAGLMESVRNTPVRVSYISAGEAWKAGKMCITCLHPPMDYEPPDANAYSECFFAEAGDFSLLLTGDVEGGGEEALLQELSRRDIHDITVLKVAHHGSRNSTPSELLKLLRPKVSVISCGRDNRYGHPHPELLKRLEQAGSLILQTPDEGAVLLRIGKRVEIRCFSRN